MGYKRANKQVSQWIATNLVDTAVSSVFRNPTAVKAINALPEVQIIIRSEVHKKDIFHDAYFSSNHILPIFHDLLAMLDHNKSLLQKGFRLSAMLFVHELQAIYWGRIPPPFFIQKLHRMLSSSDLDWSLQDPALFWILAVALTSNMTSSEQHAFFICKLRLLVRANKITSFDSMMRRIVQISWDYDVSKVRTEVLRGCFKEIF
jgi:hypothetical protein